MPKALTINKDDKQFDAFPSYEELRKLGIEHISSFSGELWTDHNIHDPGISILEVLCYALTDLGYRTNLDISEILAPPPAKDKAAQKEDNFFTPEEILTCNPLTITDIRRMLVDVEGVRNAWVVPTEEQEVKLFFEDCKKTLAFQDNSIETSDCPETELKLKGLYRVLLDVDPLLETGSENCDRSESKLTAILAEVENRLHQHRNLCEDFLEIKILNQEEIAICADLELNADTSPEQVLPQVYEAIESLISPRLAFHSLKELLQKGRSVEQIYQGRPYTPAYRTRSADKFSHGFVDIDELEKSELPTVLHASDFYRVIMEVPGVRAVKQLFLNSFRGGTAKTINGEAWQLILTPDHRPVFSPDRSKFNFFKGVLRVPFNGTQAALERFRKRLADYRKVKYLADDLDLSVPYGRHREDLTDYYSIQHEFPVTYGIGEGDLSENALPQRKAQALQLKAYLTFFDQLLANYCSQLGQIRSLFSLARQDTEGQSTYFGQIVENIPQLQKIVRFYQQNANEGTAIRSILASSSSSFEHPVTRDLAIQQLVNQLSSFNTQDIQQKVIYQTVDDCIRFQINDDRGNPLLVSHQHYATQSEASQAVQTVLFMGILPGNYEKVNLPADHCYTFNLLDRSDSYGQFLQNIIETPNHYLQRRDQFLSHLLARFGEQFTEYVLLMYALNQEQQDLATSVADKERFLSNYPAISRNRGRGFDYTAQDELWNSTGNLSGLENRVSHLMGLGNWQRSNLNPFKVELRDQACYLEIRDHRQRLLFRSAGQFTDKSDAVSQADLIEGLFCQVDQMGQMDAYQSEDCIDSSIYSFNLRGKDSKVIGYFDRTYATAELRDEQLSCLQDYFCEPLGISTDTTKVKKGFQFVLNDNSGKSILVGTSEYDQREDAKQAAKEVVGFLRSGDFQLLDSNHTKDERYGILLKVRTDLTVRYPEYFKNALARDARKNQLNNYLSGLLVQPIGIALALVAREDGWFFQLINTDGVLYLQSSEAYETEAEACSAFLYFLQHAKNPANYLPVSGSYNGGSYSFVVIDGTEQLAQHTMGYTTAKKRKKIMDEVIDFVLKRGLDYEIRQDNKRYHWCPTTEDAILNLRNDLAFQSTDEALAGWHQLYDLIADADNYQIYPKGDQFVVVLQRNDGLKIARSQPFDKTTELKSALTNFVAYWQAHPALDPAIEEQEGGYYFVLQYQDKDALVGTQRFDCLEDADCAFLHFSSLAAIPKNYEQYEEEGSCRLGFGLKKEDEWVAHNPSYRTAEEHQSYLSELQEHIREHYFPFDLKALSGDWHYEIKWENCGGNWESLFIENGSHSTEEEAKIAARNLLANYEESLFQEIDQEEDYSFQLEQDDGTVLAYHPKSYKLASDRDIVVVDAQQYFAHYQQLSGGELTLFNLQEQWWICGKSANTCSEERPLIPLSETYVPVGTDCLLSGFRLQKDEQPSAIHPVCYNEAEKRDEEKDRLYQLARCGHLPYTELCRTGSQIIYQSDKGYQYEWYQLADGAANLLWRSIQVYETEEEARTAFAAQWPQLMELARQRENIRITTEHPRLSLHDQDGAVLFYPTEETEEELEDVVKMRHTFALEYPLTGNDGAFSFRLFNTSTRSVSWSSTTTYVTANEAWQAFLAFLDLAAYAGNYRCQNDDQCNIYEMTLVETLLVSRRTYADNMLAFKATYPEDESDDEGDDPPPQPAPPILPRNFASQLLTSPLSTNQFLLSIQEASVDKPVLDSVVWSSLTPLNSYQIAQQTLQSFQQLINNGNAFVYANNPQNNTVTAYTFDTPSDKINENETDLPKEYLICPVDYHSGSYQIEDDIKLAISDLCNKDLPSHIETFCPKAWKVGLEDFLIYGTQKENYYTYLDTDRSCDLSFRVVSDQYRIARFPGEMHTVKEREKLLDWLYHFSNCQKNYLLEPYKIATSAKGGKCYFELFFTDENGEKQTHWRSHVSFKTAKSAREAARNSLLDLIAYARQVDCYELIEVSAPEEGPPAVAATYQLALVDDAGNYVLITDDVYDGETTNDETEAAYKTAIRERMLRTRQYPLYEYQGKFGFQCYSLNKIPDFTSPSEPDECTVAIPVKTTIDSTFSSLAGTIDLDMESEVVWENIIEYDHLEDARCAFECFVELLKERSNYQRRSLADCNLFGVEVTHPDEVLAEHPGSYTTQAKLQEAIGKTLACVNKEGFHLIEHILLRPKQGGPGNYRIRFRYPDEVYSDEEEVTVATVDENCFEYYYASLSKAVFTTKAEAEEHKAIIWRKINECLAAFPPDNNDSSSTPPMIITRDDLADVLFVCLGQITETSGLTPQTARHLANALAETESEFSFFENAFLPPCREEDGFIWRIRYRNAEGQWQEQSVGQGGFDNRDQAEAALRALLLSLDATLQEQYNDNAITSQEVLQDLIDSFLQENNFTDEEREIMKSALLDWQVKNVFFCFSPSPTEAADALMPTCPDCKNTAGLTNDTNEDICNDPVLPLSKGEEAIEPFRFAPGTELYVPGADPYSFWATVVLPYWPQRFQNINFRRFFEDTLRREAPAHVALRICWLDPKQMYHFDRYYRNWLEANNGQGECLLQDAKACMIDILFSMSTVYPPARLQGGDCASGTSEPGAILLDATQLG